MKFREESREVQEVFWIKNLLSLRRSNYVRETVLLFYRFRDGFGSVTSRPVGRLLRAYSEMCSVLLIIVRRHNF